MAGVKLQLPNFGRGNGNDSAQLRSYLFQLTEQLQYALNNLDIENFSEQGRSELQKWSGDAAKAVVSLSDEQTAAFNKLRGEIVETANEIRNEYKSDISKTDYSLRTEVSEQYVARSEGDATGTVAELKQYTSSMVNQSAAEMRIEFAETANIARETKEGLEQYQRDIATYIKFYEEGIEIGKTMNDQTLPYSVRITNEKMSFLQNGVEVAYIMYNKLYITAVEILERLSIGSAAMGGLFDWDTSESGMGLLWRDL